MNDGSTIPVMITRLDGTQLDLNVGTEGIVYDLKCEIAKLTHMPVEFQLLLHDMSILTNEEKVNLHWDGEKVLQMDLLFSDGGALTHQSVAVRRKAISTLSEVAHVGNKQVIEVLASYLEDENDLVRHGTVVALGKAARWFDEHVIDALSERLGDHNDLVSGETVKALAASAQWGNEKAILLLIDCLSCLGDESALVKFAVVEAVSKVPDSYAKRVMKGLTVCLKDSNHVIRTAASNALAEFERRGNSKT
eukprot:gnl/MRDRNA2_/MRDRNA2_134803_c0_seq1.p1 gnl/MRDRNA2_/MRDRNA2_134803_c0~~gnl/MRDRNA2_/MRDRNA2_134803_c0_seq1.p1  ORF type:complete len:250 (-),score=65.84 gnl/MRDRNA2_/MRDRNA2_134803_c0_seq1:41-790(-)